MSASVIGKAFFKFHKHVLDLLIKSVARWTFTSRKTSKSMQVISGMLYSQHVKETWIIFTQRGKSKWFLSKLPWTLENQKKNHCFWIKFLRWIMLSQVQKFICTSLDLRWMMEGVKDKTEGKIKDEELIWVFDLWVDFFFPYCEFIIKCRAWQTADTFGSSF